MLQEMAGNQAFENGFIQINCYTAIVFKKSEKFSPLCAYNSREIPRQTANKYINKFEGPFWLRRGFEFVQGMPHMHSQPSETDSGYSVMGTRSCWSL